MPLSFKEYLQNRLSELMPLPISPDIIGYLPFESLVAKKVVVTNNPLNFYHNVITVFKVYNPSIALINISLGLVEGEEALEQLKNIDVEQSYLCLVGDHAIIIYNPKSDKDEWVF